MWITEHTLATNASFETIWKLWEDVSSWKNWDLAIESSSLNGEFIIGATGSLITMTGQTVTFVLTEVEKLKKFSDITNLPGVTLEFEHEIYSIGDLNQITHRIKIYGPQMTQFVENMGTHFRESSRKSLAKLVEIAESNQLSVV